MLKVKIIGNRKFRLSPPCPLLKDKTMSVQQPDRILRPREICERAAFSRPTLYRFIKLGQFPQLRRIGANSVGLPESEFVAWLQSRTAA